MSQPQIALLVHELMDAPATWRDTGESITNGYYRIWMDGSRYGMGVASYPTFGAAQESLLAALKAWKEDTNWQPRAQPEAAAEPAAPVYLPPDAAAQEAYRDFARAIQSAHRSFGVHGDASVLSSVIQKSLDRLHAIAHPLERITGKATGKA